MYIVQYLATGGIGDFITALTTGLSASAFWDVITPMAPFIIAMVPI